MHDYFIFKSILPIFTASVLCAISINHPLCFASFTILTCLFWINSARHHYNIFHPSSVVRCFLQKPLWCDSKHCDSKPCLESQPESKVKNYHNPNLEQKRPSQWHHKETINQMIVSMLSSVARCDLKQSLKRSRFTPCPQWIRMRMLADFYVFSNNGTWNVFFCFNHKIVENPLFFWGCNALERLRNSYWCEYKNIMSMVLFLINTMTRWSLDNKVIWNSCE